MKFYVCLILLLSLCLSSCNFDAKFAAATPSYTNPSKVKHELLNLNTFQIEAVARDASYAYTQNNPVKVGGSENNNEILNERRFLNALRGPNGEKVSYTLEGSCCYYKNSMTDYGMLDKYVVQYGNRKVMLYLNPFEKGKLEAPRGFTFVKNNSRSLAKHYDLKEDVDE